MIEFFLTVLCLAALFPLLGGIAVDATETADVQSTRPARATIDENGVVHLPAVQIPYSDLASPQAKSNFIARRRTPIVSDSGTEGKLTDMQETRRQVDAEQEPGFRRLLDTFPVDIKDEVIGGVPTRVITPRSPVP